MLILAGIACGQQPHKATLAQQKQCHQDAQAEKGEWYFGSHYSASLNTCFVETIMKYEGEKGGVYTIEDLYEQGGALCQDVQPTWRFTKQAQPLHSEAYLNCKRKTMGAP